jgi:hypothetical protein
MRLQRRLNPRQRKYVEERAREEGERGGTEESPPEGQGQEQPVSWWRKLFSG